MTLELFVILNFLVRSGFAHPSIVNPLESGSVETEYATVFEEPNNTESSSLYFLDETDPEKLSKTSAINGLINAKSEFRLKADKNFSHLRKSRNCLEHNLEKHKLRIGKCKEPDSSKPGGF